MYHTSLLFGIRGNPTSYNKVEYLYTRAEIFTSLDTICTSRHLYSILDHKKIWMLKDKFKNIDSGFNIVNN